MNDLLKAVKKGKYDCIIIFILALIIRFIFLYQWSKLPYFSRFSADAWVHNVWANDILQNGLIRHTAFYQSPVYPYLLALFYKIFGVKYWLLYCIQAVVDSASCVLITRSAKLCYNRLSAIIAGIVAAFYIPFIFNTGLLLKETICVFCVSLFLYLFLMSLRREKIIYGWGWGLALGAAVLSRPNMLVIFFIALGYIIYAFKGKLPIKALFIKKCLAPIFGILFFISLSTFHNYLASNDFVPFNYAGGFVVYLGANPDADGTTTYPKWITSDPLNEEKQISKYAEEKTGKTLKPSQVSYFWLKEAINYIRHNFREYIWLTLGKMYLFWNKYEVPDNYDLQFIKKHFNTVLSMPFFGYGFVACFGVFGLILTGLRRRGKILNFLFWPYLLSLIPFIITDRYRMPAIVFLLPAAGYAINRLFIKLRYDAGKILLPVLCSLIFIVINLLPTPCNLQYADVQGYCELTCLYAEKAEYDLSIYCYKQAELIDESAITSGANICAAYSYRNLNDKNTERRLLMKADILQKQESD